MNILIMGGSYFFGRWFLQYAHTGHKITVINRGNIPVGLDGVTELKADRRIDSGLCKLNPGRFDAVIDFCAYEPGDISRITGLLKEAPPERYIFISTVDVYKKGTGRLLDSQAPLADPAVLSGDEGSYIGGKISLEHELRSECAKYGIKPVSVRPAILYGPADYSPRVNLYFDWIEKAGQIIHPVDADGFFQMIYVKDAARMLLALCELPLSGLDDAYNLCTDEIITYDIFENALVRALDLSGTGITFSKVPVTVDTVLKQDIPLPFPLTAQYSEKYKSSMAFCKDIPITPLEEGLLSCLRSRPITGNTP
ncbi:MAG: NAD-dependent epimerase/dehydratase family protein [Lachnospiraceae bacterium]|nr:NAD-dependent epimerase/dehydratase family protein [Lachnospiraceae bacterium]